VRRRRPTGGLSLTDRGTGAASLRSVVYIERREHRLPARNASPSVLRVVLHNPFILGALRGTGQEPLMAQVEEPAGANANDIGVP
jgi:hypothetical protein